MILFSLLLLVRYISAAALLQRISIEIESCGIH